MKQIKYFTLLFILVASFNYAGAQSNTNSTHVQKNDSSYYSNGYPKSDNKQPNPVKVSDRVDESLSKAAEAASRAAEKLQVVIEKKADKIAKESQPYIENFLLATSDLIEKLANEISKAVDEKPARR